MVRWFVIFALIAAGGPLAAAERVLVGYYATFGDLPVEQIPWKSLTHVSHAYLRIDAEGQLVPTDAMPNPALTADGRKNGVAVLAAIGGGQTVKGLEKVTADPAATAQFAAEVVKLIADNGYDGVDLVWQYPRNEATRAGHARLVAELRQRLDAQQAATKRQARYLLTVALTPTPFLGEWVDAAAVAPLVDWFGVMAFDLAGPWSAHAGHHTPLFSSSNDPERETRSVAAALRYWESERGLPKDKLVVVAPLFGRAMPVAEPYETLDPDDARFHQALSFAQIRKLVGEGWLARWDTECRAPWLSKPESEEAKVPATPLTPVDPNKYVGPALVSYEDRNSIDGKTTWAREQGYRGMGFFTIHQDRMPDGRHWLVEAAAAAWPGE